MNKIVVPEIETERLLLREITPEDLDEFARVIFADTDVLRYMAKRDLTPVERAERARKVSVENWSKHGYGAWLITDKNSSNVIGSCDFDTEEVNGGVELGYSIGKAYWGKGIATETARAAIRFGFDTAKMERIVGVVVPENTASWRVLERLGFVYEKSTQAYGWDELRFYILQRERFQPDNSFYRVRTSESPWL